MGAAGAVNSTASSGAENSGMARSTGFAAAVSGLEQ